MIVNQTLDLTKSKGTQILQNRRRLKDVCTQPGCVYQFKTKVSGQFGLARYYPPELSDLSIR